MNIILIQLELEINQILTYLKKMETSISDKNIPKMQVLMESLKNSMANKVTTGIDQLKKKMKQTKTSESNEVIMNGVNDVVAQLSTQLTSELLKQSELLKGLDSNHQTKSRTGFHNAKQVSADYLNDIFDFMTNIKQRDILTRLGDRDIITREESREDMFNEFKTRLNMSLASKQRRSTSRFRNQDNENEFSVCSDFSFQMAIKEDPNKKQEMTLKENLQHVHIDDILKIPSLPISIQSDDEHFI